MANLYQEEHLRRAARGQERAMALHQLLIGYIWVNYNYNDLTVLPHYNHIVRKGNHPQMAALFRLVKYDNLN